MTVTFTLTAGSSATAAGPFNISGTTSGGASNTVSIATGVTKAQLLTGHTVTNITPENITGGTITSTGTCNTTTTWSVTPTPTPTPTGTSPGNLIQLTISRGTTGPSGSACNGTGTLFTVFNSTGNLLTGGTIYNESSGDTLFVGDNLYYGDMSNYGRISSNGTYTDVGICM